MIIQNSIKLMQWIRKHLISFWVLCDLDEILICFLSLLRSAYISEHFYTLCWERNHNLSAKCFEMEVFTLRNLSTGEDLIWNYTWSRLSKLNSPFYASFFGPKFADIDTLFLAKGRFVVKCEYLKHFSCKWLDILHWLFLFTSQNLADIVFTKLMTMKRNKKLRGCKSQRRRLSLILMT